MKWLKRLGRMAIGILGLIVLVLSTAALVYTPVYIYRVLAWQSLIPLMGHFGRKLSHTYLMAIRTFFDLRLMLGHFHPHGWQMNTCRFS